MSRYFPDQLIEALGQVARVQGGDVYLVGGTVRDWLLGRQPHDLDLTVATDTAAFCGLLVRRLGGGALVPLGTGEEEATRVVWQGWEIDVSAFRGGAQSLDEDLVLRDFTINSMAVSLASLIEEGRDPELLDPLAGLADLERGLLRHCPRAFIDDPLRLLRAFRFMATLDFEIDAATLAEIRVHGATIGRVAAERISHELELILGSASGATVLWRMHEAGLLRPLLPELYLGQGIEQPAFHHLDVFHHNFQTLRELETLLTSPQSVFVDQTEAIRDYLAAAPVIPRLKWAALLHDVGKPAARGVADDHRPTFYRHDSIGSREVDRIGKRLKWSNDQRQRVARLVEMHMHPFHLLTVRQNHPLTVRAALKLCRRAEDELPGLFLLAMADSLAGCGELKPEGLEDELVALYAEVAEIQRRSIRPVLAGPPLIGGRDLIEHFTLRPGPVFSVILDELTVLQIEGTITSRDQALQWVEAFLRREKNS
ncbi:MAG: CCA tRNA nucleotidyltransferase [Desulfopila sp.]